MPATTIKKVVTKDPDLNRVQDAMAFALRGLLRIPILDGRLAETIPYNGKEIPIVLTTTAGEIAHKLGRKYRGFMLTGQNANAQVWEDPIVGGVDPNSDRTKFIRLVASATVTVTMWVF